jgi:hypothetical protein
LHLFIKIKNTVMENSKGQNTDRQEQSDALAGSANSDHQNASANRGGTTDMGSEALRDATGASGRGQHGSGISTKRNVTGSDYDGQVSESNQG